MPFGICHLGFGFFVLRGTNGLRLQAVSHHRPSLVAQVASSSRSCAPVQAPVLFHRAFRLRPAPGWCKTGNIWLIK